MRLGLEGNHDGPLGERDCDLYRSMSRLRVPLGRQAALRLGQDVSAGYAVKG